MGNISVNLKEYGSKRNILKSVDQNECRSESPDSRPNFLIFNDFLDNFQKEKLTPMFLQIL